MAFHILEKDAEKLNFSSSQLSLLKNWRTDYNKKQFENFEKLPETSYYIGEEKGLLFKLLMGFFASDLIIVGSQQRMLLKLYDIYEPYKSESVVILLYKNFLPIHKQMRNKQIKKNIIFVNLYNYNIEDVLTQIQNHMRIKNHFIKPE